MANHIWVIDIETNNEPYYGHVSSPKHPDNYVVMHGWVMEDEPYEGEIGYNHFLSKEEAKGWLTIPDEVGLIVAHNAPFEIEWMFHNGKEELTKFINRGGRFWCTALAEYRLSGQRHLYPSLNEVAVKYGGNTSLSVVEEAFKAGMKTKDIDPELLRDYLIGFQNGDEWHHGDIGNTRLAFYGQYAEMAERGMLNIFLAQMDGLLFNTICMSNGLKIDTEFAEEQLQTLTKDLEETEAKLSTMRYNFPQEHVHQFNPNSSLQMSAWLYGGMWKYEDREETFNKDGSPKWVKEDGVYLEDGTLVPESTVATVMGLEGVGAEDFLEYIEEWHTSPPVRYKAGRNKGKIKVERVDSEVRATRACVSEVKIKGIIDFDLYPREFVDSFKNDYKGERTFSDGGEVISTKEEAIELLLKHPATPKDMKEVLEVFNHKTKLDKILGTFYITHKYNSVGEIRESKGMLQYVTDEGLVHHNLNATATVTGRLSCTKPNLQQLPRDSFGGVKEMFVSRFGDEGSIVEIDYSNLEVIALANFSLDTNLVRQVQENLNVHDINTATYLGLPYEEYMVIKQDESHPKNGEFDALRSKLKGWEFQYQYGGTARGIAYIQGCTIPEAEAFVKLKKERHPMVDVYYEDVVESSIRSNVTNLREFRDGRWQLAQQGMFKAIGGFEYTYKTYPTVFWEGGKRCVIQDFKNPQIRNYHVQGESSVFVQIGTGIIIRHLFANNFYGGKVLPIHTTHDSITLDVHKDYLDKIEGIMNIMEGVKTWMKPYGYDMLLDFPVEATAGKNMQEQAVIKRRANDN